MTLNGCVRGLKADLSNPNYNLTCERIMFYRKSDNSVVFRLNGDDIKAFTLNEDDEYEIEVPVRLTTDDFLAKDWVYEY